MTTNGSFGLSARALALVVTPSESGRGWGPLLQAGIATQPNAMAVMLHLLIGEQRAYQREFSASRKGGLGRQSLALRARAVPGILIAVMTLRCIGAMASLVQLAVAAPGDQPHSTSARRWMEMTAEERQTQLADSTTSSSLAGRLVRMSEGFLGTPYLASPLGEGSGKDPDPLIRFDAVDCLTFVEESIALALGRSSDEVERLLTEIRYFNRPIFSERNHLMEAQWIPHNIRKGFLRPATRRWGGDATRQVWKQIDERAWSSKSARALGLVGDERPMGRFALSVIGLEELLAIAPRLESGTVLVIVRENRAFSPTRVSHVGFVIQKGRRTYLRHATRTFGKVVDEELASFVARNAKYDRWRVVGASLFDVAQPGQDAPSGTADLAPLR